MALITCPNCGEQISDKAKTCIHCGANLIPEEKQICQECGAEIEPGSDVSISCKSVSACCFTIGKFIFNSSFAAFCVISPKFFKFAFIYINLLVFFFM